MAAMVHGLNSRHGYIPRFGDWLTVVDLAEPPAVRTPAPARPDKPPAARSAAPPRPRPRASAEPEPTPTPTPVPPPAPARGPDQADADRTHAAKVARLRGLAAKDPEAHRMTRQQVLAWVWRSFYHHGQTQRAVELTAERVRILSDATVGEDLLARAKEDHANALKSSHVAEGAG